MPSSLQLRSGAEGASRSSQPRASSGAIWRTPAGTHRFGGAPNSGPVTLKASNRLVIAESGEGSIAAFPPPHNFFWSRETALQPRLRLVIGRSVRRSLRRSAAAAELRGRSRRRRAAATRTRVRTSRCAARASGHRPAHARLSTTPAPARSDGRAAGALCVHAEDDRCKAVPGYQVMATHFHSALVGRLRADARMAISTCVSPTSTSSRRRGSTSSRRLTAAASGFGGGSD